MPPRLTPDKILSVKRWLREGASVKDVAERAGCSTQTVYAIRSGERDARGPKGPYVRCKGCGGITQMPCPVCRGREAVAKRLARNRARLRADGER